MIFSVANMVIMTYVLALIGFITILIFSYRLIRKLIKKWKGHS